MPRYQKISSTDKMRIYSAFQKGENYKLLATQLGIKTSAAYAFISRADKRDGVLEKQKGGNRVSKITPEIREKVREIIEENCTLSVKEINLRLKAAFPSVAMCDRSVSRICENMFYTLKKVTVEPIDRNSLANKNKRAEFANWFLQEGILNENTIFVDETGMNIWTKRSNGRSKIGQPATLMVNGQRGPNLTLILAISPVSGIVHQKFHTGGTNAATFGAFISDLCSKVPSSALVIYDNAPCHNIQEANYNITLRRLPPWSPQLNPIEQAFSVFKHYLKGRIAETAFVQESLDQTLATQAGLSLHSWRLRLLEREARVSLEEVTAAKCRQFFHSSLSCMHKALAYNDM